MAEVRYVKEGLVTLWDTGSTLADGARKATDLDNAAAAQDESTFIDFFLTYSTDTTALTAGDIVGELYLLPSTDETTARFPTGGDGTVGTDADPQGAFLVGTFEARNPGLDTATEIVALGGAAMYQGEQRVVFKNTSGQTLSVEWQLECKVYKMDVS